MATTDKERLVDSLLSFEGGVDTGFAPSLIERNQLAWAVNTTVRGGWPTCRPGWKYQTIECEDEAVQTAFEDGYFQGAGTYISDDGTAFLVASVSGRIFTLNLDLNNLLEEITIAGDQNSATLRWTWWQQAENWLVIQNGLNGPILWNGLNTRRAVAGEVPIGTAMAYGKGRLWVGRDNLYYGGDLVWSDTTLGRDSVIKFTENTFLAGGGAWAVGGPITALGFTASLDTAFGQGDLLVYTADAIFAFEAPSDRLTWQNLEQPVQRFAMLDYGSLNHTSVVNVNGDAFFRSEEGVRSFVLAQRDFSTSWGNAPISREVGRALKFDSDHLLYACSAVNFSNRVLMTVGPQLDRTHGVWHRGLVVLDFDRVSGMGKKYPPAWEGVWTGIKILQVLKLRVKGTTRCFVFAYNDDDEVIELWEITKNARFDFDGDDDVPIEWILETRSLTFDDPHEKKRLQSADQFYDRVAGEVTVVAKYRADLQLCWRDWAMWTECTQYRDCEEPAEGECLETRYFREESRPRIALPQPADVQNERCNGFTRDGYEFQVRYEISGHMRFKTLRVVAQKLDEDLYGDFSDNECATPS